jgi:hypothetical protein
MAKLSPTQQDMIDRMKDAGGKLYRHPGGFWRVNRAPIAGTAAHTVWNGSTGTVQALVKRGVVKETEFEASRGGQFCVAVELAKLPSNPWHGAAADKYEHTNRNRLARIQGEKSLK